MSVPISRLVVVEDDHLDEEFICPALSAHFKVEPEVIRSELAFVEKLEEFALSPPDIVILDVMLTWTWPTEHQSPPPTPGPFHLAGLRCARRLGEREATKNIPILLYSTLGEEDLNMHNVRHDIPGIVLLTKGHDIQPLISHVEDLLWRSRMS